jgi:hypothetical protein
MERVAAQRLWPDLAKKQPWINLEVARRLADQLIRRHSMPAKARTDALHVAIAAVNAMDFLATWNCTHINNAAMKPRIERCCSSLGYNCPVICTPMELAVPVTEDPIVAEIHAIRARMLEECGGDMGKLIARIHRNTRKLGLKTVRLTPHTKTMRPLGPKMRRRSISR